MKRQQKKKHLEEHCSQPAKRARGRLNLVEDAQQCSEEVQDSNQEVSSEGGHSGLPQGHKDDDDDSVYILCTFPGDKGKQERQKLQGTAPETYETPVASMPAKGESSSISVNVSSASNGSKLKLLPRKGQLNLVEDAQQCSEEVQASNQEISPEAGPSGLPQGHKDDENDSVYILCTFPGDKGKQEWQKIQVSAPETHETPTACTPAKRECSSKSVNVSCASSQGKLKLHHRKGRLSSVENAQQRSEEVQASNQEVSPEAGPSGLPQGHKDDDDDSVYILCTFPGDKGKQEWQKLETYESRVACTPAKGESSSKSVNVSCASSRGKLKLLPRKGRLNLVEDAQQRSEEVQASSQEISPEAGPSGLPQGHKDDENDSVYILCTFPGDKGKQERQKIQVSVPETHETPTACTPAKRERSSKSVNVSFADSSQGKLKLHHRKGRLNLVENTQQHSEEVQATNQEVSPEAGPSGLPQGHKDDDDDSVYILCTFPGDKGKQEWQKLETYESRVACTPAKGESSSKSVNVSCASSRGKLKLLPRKGRLNLVEDAQQRSEEVQASNQEVSREAGPSGLPQGHKDDDDDDSVYILCTFPGDKGKQEWQKLQGTAPETHRTPAACTPVKGKRSSKSVNVSCASSPKRQKIQESAPETYKAPAAYTPAKGESSSSSEYYSCVSSPSKLKLLPIKERQKIQESAPETYKAPAAYTPAKGESSSSSEYYSCVSSPSKLKLLPIKERQKIQESAPETYKAPAAYTPAKGESSSSSEYYSCVSSPSKLKLLPIKERQKIQESAPETYKAPAAYTPAKGESSSSSEYYSCVSSPSKLKLLPIKERQKIQESAPETYKAPAAYTPAKGESSSSSEYYSCVSSPSKLKLLPIKERQKIQESAPETYKAPAAYTPAKGESSSSSEYYSCVSSPSKLKLLPIKERQKIQESAPETYKAPAAYTPAKGESSSSSEYYSCVSSPSKLKLLPIKERQKIQESAPETYKAPAAYTPAKGESSSSSEYYSCVSSPSKLKLLPIKERQKIQESAPETYKAPAAYTPAKGESSSSSEYYSCVSSPSKLKLLPIKERQKIQESAPETYKAPAAYTPAKGESSSSSEYYSCVSSPSKLKLLPIKERQKIQESAPETYKAPAAYTPAKGESSSSSEYYSCVSSPSKLKLLPIKERQKIQESAPETYKAPAAYTPAKGESSSSSEYYSCVSSPSKLKLLPIKERQKIQESAPETYKAPAAYTPAKGESSSSSEYYSCVSSPSKLKLLPIKERQKIQESAPETYKAPAAYTPAKGESSSSSEYYSCVSSPSKLKLLPIKEVFKVDQHFPYFEFSRTPETQDLKKRESSSPFPANYFPMRLDDNKPSTSSAPANNERVMKVYYMHVRLKRGVAILPETEESEHPRKKIKLDNIMFPERIRPEVSHSEVCTHELLCDSEVSVDADAQERPEEPAGPPEPAAPEERPARPQTPEWLVAHDHGYRCMACCRVFPSLELLQHHVEHGVSQGFSCHAFHLALASLRNKRKGKKKKRRTKTSERNTHN